MNEVITILLDQGWKPAGRTSPMWHYFGRKSVLFPSRLRYKKGQRAVTVGKRITCFYLRRQNRGAEGHIRLLTRDLNSVRAAA